MATDVMRELQKKVCSVGKKRLLLFSKSPSVLYEKTYLACVETLRNLISFFVVTVLFGRFGNSSERTESRLFNSYLHSHTLIKMDMSVEL